MCLSQLKENRLVKRVDVEEGYINIYLDGVRSFEALWFMKHLVVLYSHACVPVCTLQLKKGQKETFDVILEEDQQVGNLKPAVVKVYDYYQTSTTLC